MSELNIEGRYLKNYHKFSHDDEERKKRQNPEGILAEMGLMPGFTFVDIGCGGGFFAIPAARIVGEKGRVYGLDVDEEALARLGEVVKKEGLKNLVLRIGNAEKTILCEQCADIVFFGVVLHEFKDPSKVLTNVKRMLKPDGRLITLEWKKEPMPMGPPLEARLNEEKAAGLFKEAGFKIAAIRGSDPYHYIIIAKL